LPSPFSPTNTKLPEVCCRRQKILDSVGFLTGAGDDVDRVFSPAEDEDARLLPAERRQMIPIHRPAVLFSLAVAIATAVAATLGMPAEPAAGTAPRYETRAEIDPDGINKFYMGRQIAAVMGYQAANWLERPEREKEEQCSKLVEAIKLKPGDVVADVGAGSGYYSFRMARRVAPKGKVLAVDIQPEMLTLIRSRMKSEKVDNVEPVLGTLTDPKLPGAAVDLILLVDVYHEFSHPYEMTVEMVKSLKTGGRIVFVEYRLEDPKVPIKLVHKMTQKQVIKEMSPFPLKHVETIEVLPWQHIIIFEKTEKASERR
jgi:ubiquinone/menaquinone biosynthesis C-methylase UbiE